MGAIVKRTWTWHFDQRPESLWPAMADTARFNEAAEFPKHRIDESVAEDGTVTYTGHARIGPFALSWRDCPVEWVTNQRFRHARYFHNGPFRALIATFVLHGEANGARGDYELAVEPAGLLGRLVLAGGFFRSVGRTFQRLAGEAAAYAEGRREQAFESKPPTLTSEQIARRAGIVRQLDTAAGDRELVGRLDRFIATAPEIDLAHMRPLALARRWRVDARALTELFLLATRSGLLELRWDLLCPNCRGPKVSVAALDRLPRGAHCPTCNIDYERDFGRNVELTFRPAPSVRTLVEGEFCLFGPMTTPHVLVQQTLAAGESRDVPADLPRGRYRLRGLHPGGEAVIDWRENGFPAIIAGDSGVTAGAPAPPGIIRLINRRARETTLVVESREWVADALTADRVTTMQAFRDLFPAEALRPGDEVAIAHVTMMFTDLRGSTALYSRIGDARAYQLVREHFAFLGATIRAHDGAIVKTIGDAVMAVFSRPEDGVRAALAAQGEVDRFNREHVLSGENALRIKIGLHGGPCIAVTLNERLDYFGSTVNLAARLQGESRGDDIVLSRTLADDRAVGELLIGRASSDETTSVKGFDLPVAFQRIREH
jgi:class 3 adenylate cyclase